MSPFNEGEDISVAGQIFKEEQRRKEEMEKEATEVCIQIGIPSGNESSAFQFGYLQARQKGKEEIEKLKDIIAKSAPLTWMHTNDYLAAYQWEQEAFEAIGGRIK